MCSSDLGAALAIKALNENFDLNIEDYISINFDCMMETINAVGGSGRRARGLSDVLAGQISSPLRRDVHFALESAVPTVINGATTP